MVVAAALVNVEHDAGCRPTHVRVMMLEVLARCIYRLEINYPCQAEKPICPRPGCVLQFIQVFSSLLSNEGDCHRPSLPIRQRPGCSPQRVLGLLVVIIERGRLLPTESAIMVVLVLSLIHI